MSLKLFHYLYYFNFPSPLKKKSCLITHRKQGEYLSYDFRPTVEAYREEAYAPYCLFCPYVEIVKVKTISFQPLTCFKNTVHNYGPLDWSNLNTANIHYR